MAPPSPSIQSFFQPRSIATDQQPKLASAPIPTGDGFSGEELTSPTNPNSSNHRTPRQRYEDRKIADLVAGPGPVSLTGLIVNMYEQAQTSKRPKAAKGMLRLIIRDDTGALMLKLYYADTTYDLRLGQLCKVWTPHVSANDKDAALTPSTLLFTSIFPERDRSCFFSKLHDDATAARYKTPLGYEQGKGNPLRYLMTLKEYLDGGHQIHDSKILVCIKSIGPRKNFTNKDGVLTLKVEMCLFDNTAEVAFTLWGMASASVMDWRPSSTVLLISGPQLNAKTGASLGLARSTIVDVDPCMPETNWLRAFAARLTRRDSVVQAFPSGVFDVDAPLNVANRIRFTFADLDEFIQTNPGVIEKCTGFISVIIVEMNLINLRRDQRLLCAECCGVPVYANSLSTTCKNCEAEVKLELNPRIVGNMIDETGSLTGAKCIWSSLAFEQLLGRSAQELIECDANVIRDMQHYMLYLRFTLAFAWAEEVGKVVVCQVLQ